MRLRTTRLSSTPDPLTVLTSLTAFRELREIINYKIQPGISSFHYSYLISLGLKTSTTSSPLGFIHYVMYVKSEYSTIKILKFSKHKILSKLHLWKLAKIYY